MSGYSGHGLATSEFGEAFNSFGLFNYKRKDKIQNCIALKRFVDPLESLIKLIFLCFWSFWGNLKG